MELISWKELIEGVSGAHRAGVASLFFQKASRSLGFTSMFLGEIPPGEKLMANQMLHYDPSDKWPEHYSRRKFRLVDPMIPLAKSMTFDVITWDMARASVRKNSHAARMYREAALFDLEDGIVFLQYTPNKTIGYAHAMGSSQLVRNTPELELLRLGELARLTILKEASFSEVSEIKLRPPAMSQRMLEVLHPVMEGLTNDAIAHEFGTTAGAVERILSKLYVAFEVPDHPSLNKRVTLCHRARLYELSPIEPVLTKRRNYELSGETPTLPTRKNWPVRQ